MRLAYCRSCECPIVWTITEKGKNMPVDADPVAADRGFRLIDQGDGVPPLARWCARPEEAERIYVSHFGTCEHASAWKGRRR